MRLTQAILIHVHYQGKLITQNTNILITVLSLAE